MKKLENKKVTIAQKETTYSELITICNQVVPEKGWTPQLMSQAIKIDSICKEANGQMEFEDSDFIFVKSIIDNMRWAIKDIEIVNFCEYIKSIK